MNANETAVRNAYQVAERKDLAGWVRNRFTLFRKLARVLGDIIECLVLRLCGGAESLLLLTAHTLAVRCNLPNMEVADPNLPLAGARPS